MASGYGYIPITAVNPTGVWASDTPPFESLILSEPDPFDTTEGDIEYTFDPAGQYTLFGDVTGDVLFADLPTGFQITRIKNIEDTILGQALFNAVAKTAPYPTLLAPGSGPPNTLGMTAWDSSLGINQSDQTINDAIRALMQDVFTITCNYIIITQTDPDQLLASNGNSNQDTIDQYALPYPANVLVFEWDTNGGGGEPLDPVTDPIIVDNTVPSIQVTPPPNADTIIIEIPGVPDPIEIPITGPGPVVITLPPGTTIVIITPTGPPPFTPGPPITFQFAIDYDMSGGIDFGGTASMQIIGDPSGIYTVTEGLRHDELYERIPSDTTIEVKIPKPFIKTAFFGD